MRVLDAIDLTDPEVFAAGPPHDEFRRLRAEHPVAWTPSRFGPGFWSLTKAQDIELVSKDTELFSSAQQGIYFRRDVGAPLELFRNMLIAKDPPEHTKFRLIGQSAFTPRAVARLEEDIRSRVRALVDALLPSGRCDIVKDIAVPLPLSVIAELIGAPQEDTPKLYDWTQRLAESVDDPSIEGVTIMGELGAYLHELVVERREAPRNDFATRLMEAEVDGERLTDAEMTFFFAIIVFAGNDTTRNATSGGMRALIEHPDQLALLRQDASLLEPAVEEILRWTTPLNYFARTATRDTEIRGVTVAAGDLLVLWYASGNRDEDRYSDPDVFDITRDTGHVAFGGGGRHFCLGAGLARLELRLLIEELAGRFENPAIAGPVEHECSTWVNGLASLPVTFDPAAV